MALLFPNLSVFEQFLPVLHSVFNFTLVVVSVQTCEKPNGKHRRHYSAASNRCKRRTRWKEKEWGKRSSGGLKALMALFLPLNRLRSTKSLTNQQSQGLWLPSGRGCRFNHPIHKTVTSKEQAQVNYSYLCQSHIWASQAFSTFIPLFWSSRY